MENIGFGIKTGDKGTFVVDKENGNKVYIIFNPIAFSNNMISTTVLAPDAALIIESTLPRLNKLLPTQVSVHDMSSHRKNVTCTYNPETGDLKIRMENPVDGNGIGNVISPEYLYRPNIVIEYPAEVYNAVGDTTNTFSMKANAYLEGYSTEENTGKIITVRSETQSKTFEIELKNPKGSILLYEINFNPSLLTKANTRLYYTEDLSLESKYKVDWTVNFYSYDDRIDKFIFSEDYSSADDILPGAYKEDVDHFQDDEGKYYSMENFISYTGALVDEGAFNVLGEDGYIEIYDEETGRCISTIYASQAGDIVEYGPAKHIRIETSKPESVGTITIQNFKKIDNELLKEEYPNVEKFDSFKTVYSALHGKVKYRNQQKFESINGDVATTPYEDGSNLYLPEFDTEYNVGNQNFNPQKLNDNRLQIYFYGPDNYYDTNYVVWVDPVIFVEFPSTFKNVVFNGLINKNLTEVGEPSVTTVDGKIVMKIYTEGIVGADVYNNYVYIDFKSELDNPNSLDEDKVRVFAYNKICNKFEDSFKNSSETVDDKYDIDNDHNTSEKTRAEKATIYYTKTNSLVTTTQITDFDEKGTIVEGPDKGTVYPENSTGKARVNVKVSNGYENPIEDVVIVGRIPFMGNKSIINKSELSSNFSTTMLAEGIKGEEENLEYEVYYSTNAEASKDDSGWEARPQDWSEVKSYKIVIKSEVKSKTSIKFYYDVDLPDKLEYGKVTYATHAVYFNSEMVRDQVVEPEKVGLQIGDEKYTLEIEDRKFKTTMSIRYAAEDVTDAKATVQLKGENYGDEWSDETNREVGKALATYNDLYVGATYVVRQTQIDNPYILDTNEIRFKVVKDENGNLEVQLLDAEGNPQELDINGKPVDNPNGIVERISIDNSRKKVSLDIQNKYKYDIVVENKVKGTEEEITGSDFTLKGTTQETGGSKQKTGGDGTTKWDDYVLDKWTITQNTVGDERYEKDNEEHTLNITADKDGALVVNELGNLAEEDVWIENVDEFKKQPIVHVVIRNDYKPAVIESRKEYSIPRTGKYVLAGDEITYTIIVENKGNKATDAIVKDPIPVGTEFVEHSIQVVDENGEPIPESLGKTYTENELTETGIKFNIEPSKIVKVIFRVKVQELPKEQTSRQINNTAQVREGDDPDSPDEDPKHNPTTDPIPEYKPALEVTKAHDIEGYVTKGDEITYTITLDNKKGTAPISVLVKDKIPEHTEFKVGSIKVLNEGKEPVDGGKSYQETDLTDNGIKLTIDAGEKKYIEFKVTVLDSEPEQIISNMASYWEKDPYDPENPDEPDNPNFPEDLRPEDKKDTNQVDNEYEEPKLNSIKTSKIELPGEEERKYAIAGDTIEYTITVNNTGNMDGKATVSDNIPVGTTFVENSIVVTDKDGESQTRDDGEKYTRDDLTGGIEVTVEKGSLATVKFKVKVLPIEGEDKEKQIENTALVKHDGDDEPEEHPASDPIPEYKPDLKVTKSNKPTESVKVGDVITYTITLDNSTGKAPVKTTVKDTAPTGTIFLKNSIIVKINNLEQEGEYTEEGLKEGIKVEVPAQQIATVEFKVKVTQSKEQLNDGDKIENVATVTEEIPDPENPDNPKTKDYTVKAENDYKEPDISAEKSATIKTEDENTRTYAIKGDTITYTIDLTNNGNLDGDVIIKDEIPQGTHFVEKSIKVFDENNREVVKEGEPYSQEDLTTKGIIVTVKAQQTAKLTFDVTVDETEDAQTTIKNIAKYTEKLPDPDPDGPEEPDPDNPDPEEPKPKDKTTDEVKTPVIDFEKTSAVSRNDETAEVTKDAVTLGDVITYTITVTNNSEVTAKNIEVKDTIPASTKYKEDLSNEGSYDGETNTITWTIGELTGGQNKKLQFSVTVTGEPADGKIYNIAYVGGKPSEKVENNYVKPNIKVTKSSTVVVQELEEPRKWVTNGDTIIYVLTIENTGEAEGTVTIKDAIPKGTDLVDNSIKVKDSDDVEEPKEGGNYTKEDLTENGIVVKVKPNETKKLEFKVNVKDGEIGDNIANQATYSVKGPNDDPEIPEDPKDEPTNEVTNEYKEPKITTDKLVEISSGEAYAVPGDILTYKIEITNSGNLEKTVTVKDKVPDGTTFVDRSVAVTTDDVEQKREEVTALQLEQGIDVVVPEGSTVIVSFQVKVSDLLDDKRVAKITNKAQVDDDYTPETETTVDKSDLKISKVNDPKGKVKEGEIITYSIILDNTKGTAPTTVKVKDEAPDGTEFVNGSIKIFRVVANVEEGGTTDEPIEGQTYNEDNLNQGIQIEVKASEKLKVQFQVKVQDSENGTKIRNVATVTDVPPEDPVPPTEPQERETPPVENVYVEPIITVEKNVATEYGRKYVVEGETITYTISIKNDGDLAETVTLKDAKPAYTEFVEDSIVLKANNEKVDGSSYTEQDLNDGIDIKVEPKSTYTLEFKVKVLKIEEGTDVTIKNVAYYKEKKDPEPDPDPDPEKPTPEVKTPVVKYSKKADITRNTTEEIAPNAVTAGDVIKYTITVENISDVDIENVTIKDDIPEGTTLKKIYDEGQYNNDREITWKLEQLPANTKKEVSFDVTVNYQSNDTTIKNVAKVDDKPTNEVDTPYEKPEVKLNVDVQKSGDRAITNEETKVMYKIEANTTIKDFVGKAKITIVDTLPFPIDDLQSDLDEGKYQTDDIKHTITWEETVDVDTYKSESGTVTIERVKNLQLKYIYPDINDIGETVDNEVTLTVELLQNQKDPDNPEEPEKEVTVEKKEDNDEHNVSVEIPAEVVVHHYLWDDSKGGATTDELAPEKHIEGFVGRRYETEPSDEVDPNYECVNPRPDEDNHTGTFEKDQKDVYYYYKLKDPVIENSVEKTADIKLLTQEDGIVKYHIEQSIRIDKYKGRVTITITDKLPAKINEDASELQEGQYDDANQTITWTKDIDIDTFENEAYTETITKDIELVYLDRNFVEPLTNTVNAKVTLYNPDDYTPNPGGERKTDEQEDTETVEQRYTVDKEVQKEWQDNGDYKNRRPTSVTVELTSDGIGTNNKAVLEDSNDWSASFENLPKYSSSGAEIVYSVVETETKAGDLAFYEEPIVDGENPIVITNRYKTMEANVDASVDKIQKDNGTITESSQKIKYEIRYNATIKDYVGDAKLTIVDHLPYHIDESKSTLSDGTYTGVYDANRKTITWEIPMNNINADKIEGHKIDFDTNIELVFSDMDASISMLSNNVEARLDLYETDSSKTVTDTEDIPVDIKGKLVVHYKDTATGEEITYEENGEQKQYKYEQEGKVGDSYTTDRKTIPDYVLDHIEGDEVGTYPDGTVEVTYWYKSDKSGGIDVKWVDEDGNDIVPPEHIPGEGEPGKVGDPYHTEPKDFDDYVLDYVEGEPDGTLPEGTGEVVYHYKRRIGRVVVQYLEKGTEEELLPEKVEEYPVGDSYTTERERVPNYRRADPEPENKSGTVTKEDTYVKYYYERIPSGKVVTKHVDVETGEDILHPDEETGEYVPYGDVQEGYVGDSYTTEPEDIPYYKVVEELLPPNREGVFEEEDKEVIYYYVKQVFNFKVDKVITKATINGEEQKVLDGKLIKVEVVGSEMENTEVVITYKIRVENTGEIAGTATVVEKLPKHFTIGKEAYNEWTENEDGDLEAEVSLEPGETKEFTIKLTWKNGSENFGREINSAEIKGFENDAHYEDKDKEDNISEAEVVMGVKTGAPTHIFFIIYSVVILIAIAEVIVYVRKAKTIK